MQGGNSCVASCLSGALIGCSYGFSNLPSDWIGSPRKKQTDWLNVKINLLLDMMAIPWLWRQYKFKQLRKEFLVNFWELLLSGRLSGWVMWTDLIKSDTCRITALKPSTNCRYNSYSMLTTSSLYLLSNLLVFTSNSICSGNFNRKKTEIWPGFC